MTGSDGIDRRDAYPTRDWSAGGLGLYKGGGQSAVTQFDDFKVGFDNNDDGDIADAGDDILVDDDFNSNQTSFTYDNKSYNRISLMP